LADELLTKYTPAIEELLLIPSGGGLFEVIVGDELLYSKKATGRHATEGEVANLFEEKTGASPVES
jgi:selenoprotein W-related protein